MGCGRVTAGKGKSLFKLKDDRGTTSNEYKVLMNKHGLEISRFLNINPSSSGVGPLNTVVGARNLNSTWSLAS